MRKKFVVKREYIDDLLDVIREQLKEEYPNGYCMSGTTIVIEVLESK